MMSEGCDGRTVTIAVPDAATPGKTVMGIKIGLSCIDVLVPSNATAGDKLILTENKDTHQWSSRLVRTTASQDTDACKDSLHDLTEAVRRAGGFVSSKLEHKQVDASGLKGVCAREAILAGEELLRIPASLHISEKTVKAVAPELYEAFCEIPGLEREGLRGEARLATFEAKLLADSMMRLEKEGSVEADGSASSVWKLHSEAMLHEKFESHPHWGIVHAHARTLSLLAPSPECTHVEARAKETMQTCKLLMQQLPRDLLGDNFRPGYYLQARLCTLTRTFDCAHLPSLVPVADLFNHSHDQGLAWQFTTGDDTFSIRSLRAHAQGEELFVSYGLKPNPLLHRTYGFTLAPQHEPSWAFVLQGPKPRDIYSKYLPESLAEHVIHLDSVTIKGSLVLALDAVKKNGHDASDFLRNLCTHYRDVYEQDAPLKSALAALQRVRAAQPSSSAWWNELSEQELHPAGVGSMAENALRVKMSEYLALVTHIEIADLVDGRAIEEDCLSEASVVREILCKSLGFARSSPQALPSEALPN